MTTTLYLPRGRRLYRQAGKHPQILCSGTTYVKLQRIQQRVTRSTTSEMRFSSNCGIEHERPEGP